MSKKIFPLSPPVLLSPPGCFQAHIFPWCVLYCHSQTSSCLLHQPPGSNELRMLVDPIHTVAGVGHSL